MEVKDYLKENYRRNVDFHLRCAIESTEKLMGELDPKDVEDIAELAIGEDRINLIRAVIVYGK